MIAFPYSNEKLKSLSTAVHAALKSWHMVGGQEEGLLSFLLIVQRELDEMADVSPPSLQLATSTILERALAELEGRNEEGMRVLKMRFQDGMQIREVAPLLSVSEYTVSHRQREAIEQVANLLKAWEEKAWQERAKEITARLPSPTSSRLFGVDEPLAHLVEAVLKEGEPWVTAVVGIGGIGKTSLTLRAAREIVPAFRFENVVWVRLVPSGMSRVFESPQMLVDSLVRALDEQLWPNADGGFTPQQRLIRVRHLLKQHPLLVVVDNIEGAADAETVVQQLHDWCNPSKFVLTSRVRPQGVLSISLEQLSRPAAMELIDYYLKLQNVVGADSLTEADMDAIYRYTGGNPMALKLVVNLLDSLTLPKVLEGFLAVNTDSMEELYHHVYWQNWQTMSEAARTLLEAMIVVSKDGADLTYLQGICGLAERPLHSAITELRQRSLLDVDGDLHHRRYHIHPLTQSFLQTEIIHRSVDLPFEQQIVG